MAATSDDNVVHVSFKAGTTADGGSGAEDETSDLHRDARAIVSCLRYLQEEASRIDHPTAANLIGAAVQALTEDRGSRDPA